MSKLIICVVEGVYIYVKSNDLCCRRDTFLYKNCDLCGRSCAVEGARFCVKSDDLCGRRGMLLCQK